MRLPSRPVVISWLEWGALLALATVALYANRTRIEQVHVVLAFLLIILGGTAYGGRFLGIALSLSAFVLIDYFFQAPYDRMSVGSSLDWLVLVAFLVTVAVTMHLLARAQRAAARAQRHASEVAHLSRFGSELLSAGRASDALEAIADAVRETLAAESCAVFLVAEDGQLEALVQRGRDRLTDLTIARDVARGGADIGVRLDGTLERGVGVPEVVEGTIREEGAAERPRFARGVTLRALWTPLRARGRTVGVLGVASAGALALDDVHWRFADALRFYVALAVERARTAEAIAHAEAMREADRLRNALFASVSHDLRTPLTTIKVLAQESGRHHDLELALSNARVIEEHADRLARVVSNVLDVSRLRANALPVRCELNTAEDLIGAVARQCAGVLGGRTLERHIEGDGSVLTGCFDFVQSLRILTNLVENAIRYSPARAPVRLTVRRDGDELVFEVADSGPGVPPTQRERIFEPFYRAPGIAPDVGGTGLGLYIARALAEAQRGTLTQSPGARSGSVFTLRLPALDWPDEELLGAVADEEES